MNERIGTTEIGRKRSLGSVSAAHIEKALDEIKNIDQSRLTQGHIYKSETYYPEDKKKELILAEYWDGEWFFNYISGTNTDEML